MKVGFAVYEHLLELAVEEDSAREKKKKIGPDKLLVHTRAVLLVLIERALTRRTITYGEISELTPSKPAQNANTSFGAIALLLDMLGVEALFRGSGSIPNISAIVVQSGKELGGKGVFLAAPATDIQTAQARFSWLQKAQQAVFDYPKWREVLAALGLRELTDVSPTVPALSTRGGVGEQAAHRALKEFVSKNPSSIGLEMKHAGEIELPLPSGDRIDVSFQTDTYWVCAEVKPSSSLANDVLRGLFQTVKYVAILQAILLMRGQLKVVRCPLVLGGRMPEELRGLAARLNIEVIEQVERMMVEVANP